MAKIKGIHTTGFGSIDAIRRIITDDAKDIDVEESLADLKKYEDTLKELVQSANLMEFPAIQNIVSQHEHHINTINKALLTQIDLGDSERKALIFQKGVHEIWVHAFNTDRTNKKIGILEEVLTKRLELLKKKKGIK